MLLNIISGIFFIIVSLQAVLKRIYEHKSSEDIFAHKSGLEVLVYAVQIHHLIGFLVGTLLIIQYIV